MRGGEKDREIHLLVHDVFDAPNAILRCVFLDGVIPEISLSIGDGNES